MIFQFITTNAAWICLIVIVVVHHWYASNRYMGQGYRTALRHVREQFIMESSRGQPRNAKEIATYLETEMNEFGKKR